MYHFGALLLLLFVSPLLLIASIFYAITLYRALSRCAPESRAMEPGLVWLIFIPFFNLVWNFVVVFRVATSLQNEFRRRGTADHVDAGRELGLAMCILACLAFIPFAGIFFGTIATVCWIVYWAKIAGLSARLMPMIPSAQPAA